MTNGNTSSFISWGNTATTGNSGSLGYYHTGNNSTSNAIQLTFANGVGGNLTIPNNTAGTSTFNTFLSANPRYGIRHKPGPQTISIGGNTPVNWTDTVAGPLTSDGITYTNSTGATLIVLFNYSLLWDPAFGGGAVAASLVQAGPIYRQRSYAQVFPSGYYATCTGSVIISMANGSTVQLWAANYLGGALDVKGGAASSSDVSRMDYYILN